MRSVRELWHLMRSIRINHFSCLPIKSCPINVHKRFICIEFSIKEIYATQKDPEDGLLYFKYSNVDPF